ncbi:conserved hypothetical protein [Planktothrix serta PCC 8927]|uniref:Uncharacterized protein n=1 Tax=Planktothrix serta PCC 8927 TaxID=671068 RepID=A0A7Z9DZA8_9CYAN|nr:hypothetical protein [Planktothrix serta]VXD20120.1 conserved hypothetical protein [Planktothrix serta PCC 8927]
MAYWIKMNYDRETYLIDLDSISAFASGLNKRITLWLPANGKPIIINYQNNPQTYEDILDYIQKITVHSLTHYWIKIIYDRHEYIVDLNRLNTFVVDSSKRIMFWLPDGKEAIIINPQTNSEAYSKILDFIQQKTGYSLP